MTRANHLGCPPSGALLVAGALGLAVFYNGPQITLLAGAQALLVLWLALALIRRDDGVPIPATAIAMAVGCFWGWLALSLSWSPVPGTSVMVFWWVGSLALAFWAYALSPECERVWRWAFGLALVGALALCVMALVQLFLLGEPPRATFVNIHSFAAMLMLVALPATAYWLTALQTVGREPERYVLGAALFLLFFTIATTQGRGTTLSLFIGMVTLAGLTYRQARRAGLLAAAGLALGAYIAANLLLQGAIGTRLSTLADPAGAAFPRLLIWKGSLQMALDHPWLGTGLGTYYLLWPQYRDPTDSTLGFFAHNDYLHLWIEAGLAGPVLLLVLYAAVLVHLVRYRKRVPEPSRSIEAAGLFCGLLAISAHSLLDFNLYILPISILAGLTLGRLHELLTAGTAARHWSLRPRAYLRPRVYRLVVALIALFPLSYFVALGTSDYLYNRGFALAGAGDIVGADESFAWAERLTAADDKVMLAHADLYRHLIALLPADSPERPVLYREAMALLDAAQTANPYRATIHAVRARLYEENARLVGPEGPARAAQEYRRALTLDPRFFRTRTSYARMLLETGDRVAARRVLEEGVGYWYFPDPALAHFYEMTASARRDTGDAKGAAEMEDRVRQLKAELSRLAAVRPIAPDRGLPTAAARP